MSDSLALANRLLLCSPLGSVTHLKLQKLLFYAYGGICASDLESDVGVVRFVAWKHGPVNESVYREYSSNGREPLGETRGPIRAYSPAAEAIIADVLSVYGRLSPWQLREETHLEQPWQDTAQSAEIPRSAIKAHFKQKFAPGAVAMPRNLVRAWSFDVDGVPLQRWPSLHSLADALSR